jgi:hypothetical protein
MSSNFTEGQLVRLSPDVVSETAENDALLGKLGVPGLLRHAIFEVVSQSEDDNYGAIVRCRITNPEVFKEVIPGVKEVKYEGELVLLVEEIVPTNEKITLEYNIISTKTNDEMIKELFAQREVFKSQGYDKRHRQMRDNWKQIQILRGEVSGPAPSLSATAKVYLPKHKLEVEVNSSQLPSGDPDSIKKFERLLANKIRSMRSSRRSINYEHKVLFGMIEAKKVGGVYLKENSLLAAYEEMMKTTLETDKKPSDPKATYVGIEIEFIYTGDYEALKKLLIEKKLHRYICLKEDGSLRACHNTNGYRGKELTLICKTTEVEDVLKKLDSVFLNPKIDGFANRSCGLHVHLDVRNRNADMVFKNLVRIQNILRASQPVGRINNVHCRPNSSDDLDKESMERGSSRHERYSVVNGLSYAKHKSIEVRVHEGTVDCEAIYNWVEFLNAIANHTAEIPKNTLKFSEDLVAKYDISIPLYAIDYIDKRIERFNSLAAV